MTPDEKKFIAWWQANREKQKKTFRQWYIGLPIGLLFVIPIVVNLSSGWYKRADMEVSTQLNPVILMIAMLIIVSFIAIFYKKHQWDMNEQRFLEMKAKEDKEAKNGGG